MSKIEQRIKEANGRLRSNNYDINVQQIGSRLYLRATLPPKPQSTRINWHQQRINIAVASSDGVKLAEKSAKILRLQLDTKTFDWSDYMELECKVISQIIEEFEKDYFQRRAKNFKSESTWRVEYATVFKTLDFNSPLTAEILKTAILATVPDTRTRKRFCSTLGALAKFARINFDPSKYSGNYSPKSRKPRDLPTDKLIVECYSEIEDYKWQWVFGMLATYGLRNHEVFFLDLKELMAGNKILSVLQGKTGYRRIWPYHPEWFDQFGLQNVKIPDINWNR
jgi:integrase